MRRRMRSALSLRLWLILGTTFQFDGQDGRKERRRNNGAPVNAEKMEKKLNALDKLTYEIASEGVKTNGT